MLDDMSFPPIRHALSIHYYVELSETMLESDVKISHVTLFLSNAVPLVLGYTQDTFSLSNTPHMTLWCNLRHELYQASHGG